MDKWPKDWLPKDPKWEKETDIEISSMDLSPDAKTLMKSLWRGIHYTKQEEIKYEGH